MAWIKYASFYLILLIGLGLGRIGTAAPLTLDVYNSNDAAGFAVTSVIVGGERDALVIDAQMGKSQAEALVARVRASGKRLTTIYISHADPDYYFGLQTLSQAFPDARILASAPTVAHIRATMLAKLAFWGPQMGSEQPTRLVVPEIMEQDYLLLEGQRLEIFGLNGPQPQRTVVWIPSIRAIVGGVLVSHHLHVWMADTTSPAAINAWKASLLAIKALQPEVVVPGHYLDEPGQALQAVDFTLGYISDFQQQAAANPNAEAMIAAMIARYPDLGDVAALETSAKVAKGEMSW